MDFLALFQKVGFADVEVIGETGFNSSPITKGILFRAKKSTVSNAKVIQQNAIAFFSERKSSEIQATDKEGQKAGQASGST